MTRDENLLPLLYDHDLTAGWHAGMVALTRRLLHGVRLPLAPRVLEVGCGGGDVLQMLATELPDAQITGLDLNELAVQTAASRPGQSAGLGQADLLRLPFRPRSFDLLLALDSLDQVGVPLGSALAEAWRVLLPGGQLLVRVSAYPWLYGTHDRAFNTGRRYTSHELLGALRAQGFQLVRATHANALLAPPVIALRMLGRLREGKTPAASSPGAGSDLYASAAANRVVHTALTLEAQTLRWASFPAGLSLFALARKVSA
jgi:SAM-dependent methyltransferase